MTFTEVASTARKRLEVGLERHRAGDRTGAERTIRQAAALHPGEPTALYLLGLLRLEADDLDAAETLFGEVLSAAPRHAQSWLDARFDPRPARSGGARRRGLSSFPGTRAGLGVGVDRVFAGAARHGRSRRRHRGGAVGGAHRQRQSASPHRARRGARQSRARQRCRRVLSRRDCLRRPIALQPTWGLRWRNCR